MQIRVLSQCANSVKFLDNRTSTLTKTLLPKNEQSISKIHYPANRRLPMKMAKRRIVIIGGGFGGAFAAKYLRRYGSRNFEIELIDSTNYFVFQPLLPEVVSGTISAPDQAIA
ncbi:MAG: FAD-dependent oxidoreductase [Planctomycetes bacterium]|nr:FAD-dependent oxidoreductase [Planctomycetota bacterium]